MERLKGLVMKGIGGFYYVDTAAGLIETRGRGTLKRDGDVLCVGDEVELTLLPEDESKGVIEEILPRKNFFRRPPLANVDLLLTVFAARSPKPNFPIIDKFLINAEMKEIETIVCVNKRDLVSAEELDKITDVYERAYKVVALSAHTGEGLAELLPLLQGKKTALAGPSGAGKSSLLNALHPQANSQTGAVSSKTQRGRHTTRHVEIFRLEEGGMIFDTPGFTSFEIEEADENGLSEFYPEMARLRGRCRYDDCKHLKEPGCAVREAAAKGEISPIRYKNYVAYVEELSRKKKY